MTELIVEGWKLDVDDTFSIMLNLAIDDIADFGFKNTPFSKTIVLKGTPNNNAALGFIFQANLENNYSAGALNIGVNYNPTIAARAYIFAGGIQTIKGVFRLLKINIVEDSVDYECSIVGELGGLIAKFRGKKLEDLNFSELNHEYVISDIVGTWADFPINTALFYPLIDYGGYSINKNDWDVRTFRPAIGAKAYIDKMFAAAGYTYECALFDTNRFKGLVVPFNKKKFTTNRIGSSNLVVAGVAGVQTYQQTIAYIIDSNLISGSGFNAVPVLGQNTYVYTGTTANYNIVIDYNVNFTFSSVPNDISLAITTLFRLDFNGSGGFILANFDTSKGSPISVNRRDKKEFNKVLNFGDVITLQVESYGDWTYTYDFTQFFVNMTITPAASYEEEIPYGSGDEIQMNEHIPRNYLQTDFLSSIVKLFNLYIFEDKDKDNHLKIMPYVDFFASAAVDDWTDKIDLKSPIKITPNSELNARYYNFKYKPDSDFYNDLYAKRYNETYGSYSFDTGFEFGKDKSELELIFSGTPLVGYAGQEKVYSTIFKMSNGVEESTESNIRLLQTKMIIGLQNTYDIYDPNGNVIRAASDKYPYAGHLDDPDAPTNDLNFGVAKEFFFKLVAGSININQFNVYWSSYMAEVTNKDAKLIQLKALITFTEIYKLDFSRLIYWQGCLFRLNKIEEFNTSKRDLCNVELLKIQNRVY